MSACSMSRVPFSYAAMPSQSSGCGVPSPVVPPTELSLSEVNTIGWDAVPTASSAPLTSSEQERPYWPPLRHPFPPLALTTAPGAIVRVLPAGTRTRPARPHAAGSSGSVELVASVPASSTTSEPLPVALLPPSRFAFKVSEVTRNAVPPELFEVLSSSVGAGPSISAAPYSSFAKALFLSTSVPASSPCTPTRAWLVWACSMARVPFSYAAMPSQSSGCGVPSPVVPPTELSLSEVNTIGWDAVPTASSAPLTSSEQERPYWPPLRHPFPPLALTTAPGAIVRVLPAGTRTRPARPHAAGSSGSVEL